MKQEEELNTVPAIIKYAVNVIQCFIEKVSKEKVAIIILVLCCKIVTESYTDRQIGLGEFKKETGLGILIPLP